jgi:ribosomal protein S18 acetylase RimI-like enzyme
MDKVNIRPASINDCPAMMQLVNELALYEKAPEEVSVTLEHFIESGFGDKPVYWAFVAEVNNAIVGFALCYLRYSTWKGQRCYLEDIIVNEAYRGKGIGKQLMETVIADAKQKKLHGVSWQVLDWNTPAIEFYKKYNTHFDGEWVNCMISF